jgi:hypothetical protein
VAVRIYESSIAGGGRIIKTDRTAGSAFKSDKIAGTCRVSKREPILAYNNESLCEA